MDAPHVEGRGEAPFVGRRERPGDVHVARSVEVAEVGPVAVEPSEDGIDDAPDLAHTPLSRPAEGGDVLQPYEVELRDLEPLPLRKRGRKVYRKRPPVYGRIVGREDGQRVCPLRTCRNRIGIVQLRTSRIAERHRDILQRSRSTDFE